jgi:hypothetical protein
MPLRESVYSQAVRFTAACLAALVVTAGAQAQGDDLPMNWTGWRVVPFQGSNCAMPPALYAATIRSLQQIGPAVARLDPLKLPGKYIAPSVYLTGYARDCRGSVAGDVGLALYDSSEVVRTTDRARPALKPHHGESGGALDFYVNAYPPSHEVDFADGMNNPNPNLITRFRPTSMIQGFPVLDNRHILVAAPGHSPVYVPVTVELAFTLAIVEHQRQLDSSVARTKWTAGDMADTSERIRDMKKAGLTAAQLKEMRDQAMGMLTSVTKSERPTLDQLRQQLAALSPADRQKPAYVVNHGTFWMPRATPGDDAEALVMPNPAYFDPKLARSVPQLMYIDLGHRLDDLNNPDFWQMQAVQRLNLTALAKDVVR